VIAYTDYARSLFVDVEDYATSDDAWLEDQWTALSADFEGLNLNTFYRKLAEIPTLLSVVGLEKLAQRNKRERLSEDTLQACLRGLELRRMRAIFRTVTSVMRTGHKVETFLNELCDSLYHHTREVLEDDTASKEMAVSQVVFHFSLAYHEIHGKPVYAPSRGLSEALIYTEFRDVPASMFKLPHDALYIEIPLDSGLYVPNEQSGLHTLRGIYITKRSALPLDWEAKEGNARPLWGSQVLLIGNPKEASGPQVALINDALLHFHLYASEGETLGQVIARTAESVRNWEELEQSFSGERLKLSPDMRVTDNNEYQEALVEWREDGFSRVLRFVVNTLLYITLPDAELVEQFVDPNLDRLIEKAHNAPKGSAKRAKLHAEVAKANKQKITVLGSSVKIDRSHLKDAGNGAGGAGTGRKLAVQYIRRGHWRNQPYGPGRTLQRLQWIRPTAVGPKDAPLKKITYDLGSS